MEDRSDYEINSVVCGTNKKRVQEFQVRELDIGAHGLENEPVDPIVGPGIIMHSLPRPYCLL